MVVITDQLWASTHTTEAFKTLALTNQNATVTKRMVKEHKTKGGEKHNCLQLLEELSIRIAILFHLCGSKDKNKSQ